MRAGTLPLGSRIGAAAALVVAAGHVPGLVNALPGAPAVAVLLLALTLGCTHCAVGLWSRPCARTWWIAAGMGVGMLLMHRVMPAAGAGGMAGMPGMARHTSPLEVVPTVAQGLLVALAAVALLQTYRPRALTSP